MKLLLKRRDIFSPITLASLALVFSKDVMNFSHAQDSLPALQRNGKLSDKDLVPYQACTEDSDCVSFNNGLCDCANGGKEISINSDFTSALQGIFDAAPPRACTKIGSPIPCGIGGGNVCQNSKCRFRPCADESKARQCSMNVDWEALYDNSSEIPDPSKALENCMLDSCKVESDDSSKTEQFETETPSPSQTSPSQGLTIPTTLIRNGKYTRNEMRQFQECETDSDCAYVQNGFCDCANGGEEQAVHVSKQDEFNSIFQSRPYRCTKMTRGIPCGIGAGVICNARNLCEFQPCRNRDALNSCDTSSDKVVFVACLEEACAADNPVEETSSSNEESASATRPGILGGFIGNIFITRDPDKQLRPGNRR